MKRPGMITTVMLMMLILICSTLPAAERGISVVARTPTGDAREVTLYSGYHALVVGCGDYRAGWPKLPNPVSDAREVAAMLKRFGWSVEKLENPDGRTLSRALSELAAGPGRKEDVAILFWYSGHGQTLPEADGTKLGYLVPVDAPDPERDRVGFMESAISMRTIETVAKQIMSRHVLMAFDSCFSGAIFQMVRAKPSPYIQEKVSWPVRQFITAGTETEQVPDRSVFKDVFIQGVRDGFADINGDTYITGEELGGYLQEQVVNYTQKAQHPQFGKINNPKLDKGDFVFLTASSGVTIDTPASAPSADGRLSVTSNVSSAEVYVDGSVVGKTPLSGLPVSPGSHRVQVMKSGYDAYTQTITISAGRSASLEAYLDPAAPETGRLYVDATPEDARVRITNIGPAFRQGMELAPGTYTVEVSASGYETVTRQVSLSAGEDKRVAVRLAEAAPAKVSSGNTYTNSLGMRFVYIEPGSFMMGSLSSESGEGGDETKHRVTLTQGYWMQTTEVTQAQWKAVMGSNPSNFKGDDLPVEMVSWNDIQEFIRKLNRRGDEITYSLPTEAQWEYAARAGSNSRFCFGDSDGKLGDYAWYDSNSGRKTHPVGQKQPNAWGLYDMHGNVWEWCQDWYGDYPSGSVTDPVGPSSGANRVIRGGGWIAGAGSCRSAFHYGGRPDIRVNDFGFRVAASPGR